MPRVQHTAGLFTVALLFLLSPAVLRAQLQCSITAGGEDPVSQQASSVLAQLPRNSSTAGVLKTFYEPCHFALAWSANGKLTPQARSLIAVLNSADEKGLRPSDYGAPQWGVRSCALDIRCDEAASELAYFDLDLTSAAIRLISDLLYGRVALAGQRADLNTHPDPERLASIVWSQLVASPGAANTVQQLEPSAPGYLRAEAAIHRYLIMERESPDIVVPSEIRSPHPSASTVTKLTQRLAQLGDIPSLSGQPDLSDPEMISIIKRFQSRHDLPTSGIIDARTLQQLNVPIARRLEQLNLTLERWRWVPRSFSEAPVVVNIPEFRLRAYDEHLNVALSMPVIVGRVAHRKTPVLQATMTQVIFHPYWNVPRDIQQREIVPHILRSPGYLAARDYELVNRNGGVEHLSTSATVAGLSNGTLRVRQVPGAKNALGSIKFVFPNGYNVYMHGTPEMNLFQQTRRDFSHGCIRVQDPGSLAAWVLRRQDGWSREHIDASVANPASTTIFLSHPIPVLVVYGTGIAAEDESIKFLDDVYGYDATLEKSLDQLSETRRLAQR